MRSYWVNAHGFIDYKKIYAPRSEKSNRELEEMCKNIHLAISVYEVTNDLALRKSILEYIDALSASLKSYMPFVSDALQEIHKWILADQINPEQD
jgi:hypothetical protein